MRETSAVNERVRRVLQETVSLAKPVDELRDDSSLYDLGLSSFDLVSLLVALEEHFQVDFPNTLMQRETFGSVARIAAAIELLTGEQRAA